jgi:hypothetical protein
METAHHPPTTQNTTTAKAMLNVKQFAEKHPAFPEHSLRWIIFNRETNGFGDCFCKVGKKRILVDEERFFSRIEENRMG